ncbi:MAG: GNAT family N-acetyltransferase [Bacteroidales bacterium]|jgi:hypothetical protein|nr:GNAT family N-acetyltransferase [Bacteroidales bacterium]
MLETIISPVDKALIKAELTTERLLRETNVGGHSIYSVTAHEAPNTMREIGRLREYTFRAAGAGTGKACDIDEYDLCDHPFRQLIVWNNETEEIISAYRYILGKEAALDKNGYPFTSNSEIFYHSPEFVKGQWQESIELGRSFVQPKYQATNNLRTGMYALDNVWDGLGALIVKYPEIKYFIGKMTIYDSYNREARNLILAYLEKHHKATDGLLCPFQSSLIIDGYKDAVAFFHDPNASCKEDFKLLTKRIRELKVTLPPLVKTYISLSPSLRYYGPSRNPGFGPVDDTCIIVTIPDIYEHKIERHVKGMANVLNK